MLAYVIMIDEVVADEYVHDGECEHGVGAGAYLEMPVAGCGGAGVHGIDTDNFCTVATGLFDDGPEMEIGNDGIGAPEDYESAVYEVLGIDTNAISLGGCESGMSDSAADISVELAGADQSEQALIERGVLYESLISG